MVENILKKTYQKAEKGFFMFQDNMKMLHLTLSPGEDSSNHDIEGQCVCTLASKQ